jgi:hypothetical protein
MTNSEEIEYRVTEVLPHVFMNIPQVHHFEAQTIGISPSYSYGAQLEGDAVLGIEKWIRTEAGAVPKRVLPNLVYDGVEKREAREGKKP